MHKLSQWQEPNSDATPRTRWSICVTVEDKTGEARALNNISQIYKAKGDYDTALSYLQRSLTICETIENKTGEAAALNNISQIYKAKGDHDTRHWIIYSVP